MGKEIVKKKQEFLRNKTRLNFTKKKPKFNYKISEKNKQVIGYMTFPNRNRKKIRKILFELKW